MTEINKQKFLAEMSRLLTFMYEEDQQLVLSMYSSLFDDANDEQALLDFLGSPTRQAVMLARAYNAKERKLQVHTSSRADALYPEDEEAPVFLEALESMREEAEDCGFVRGHSEPAPLPLPEKPVVLPEIPLELPVEEEPVRKAPTLSAPIPEPVEKKPPIEKKPPVDVPFTMAATPEKKEEKSEFVIKPGKAVTEEAPAKAVSIPLAVVYSIFAVPITIALCVILLVPAFASLGACIACSVIGFKVFASAFGAFYMFSDIMVVLGCGIIILALGLLFLWIFVWFVGGAIAGMINSVIALGSKWCSKEVPVK